MQVCHQHSPPSHSHYHITTISQPVLQLLPIATCWASMQLQQHALNPTIPRTMCSVPEDCPAAVRDIVSQCLERDPALRPRVAEVAALLGGDPQGLQTPLSPRPAPAGGPEVGFRAG